VGIEQVLGGIQRHGDVGLGRADQIHRQAVLLNCANTSARKPTCCHMPTDSIETRVMPLRALIALTLGACSRTSGPITVPSSSGRLVSLISIGTRGSRSGDRQRGCSTLAPVEAISWASS